MSRHQRGHVRLFVPLSHPRGGALMWEFVTTVLLFWAIFLWIFAFFAPK